MENTRVMLVRMHITACTPNFKQINTYIYLSYWMPTTETHTKLTNRLGLLSLFLHELKFICLLYPRSTICWNLLRFSKKNEWITKKPLTEILFSIIANFRFLPSQNVMKFSIVIHDSRKPQSEKRKTQFKTVAKSENFKKKMKRRINIIQMDFVSVEHAWLLHITEWWYHATILHIEWISLSKS